MKYVLFVETTLLSQVKQKMNSSCSPFFFYPCNLYQVQFNSSWGYGFFFLAFIIIFLSVVWFGKKDFSDDPCSQRAVDGCGKHKKFFELIFRKYLCAEMDGHRGLTVFNYFFLLLLDFLFSRQEEAIS